MDELAEPEADLVSYEPEKYDEIDHSEIDQPETDEPNHGDR